MQIGSVWDNAQAADISIHLSWGKSIALTVTMRDSKSIPL